jgi:hypothetical protein
MPENVSIEIIGGRFMEKIIHQSEKDGELKKGKQNKKFLNMIIEGKLKDPPPLVLKNISGELGMDLLTPSDDK